MLTNEDIGICKCFYMPMQINVLCTQSQSQAKNQCQLIPINIQLICGLVQTNQSRCHLLDNKIVTVCCKTYEKLGFSLTLNIDT